MRFNICSEIWIKCRIKVFQFAAKLVFVLKKSISKRKTSIYFLLYNLQFTLVVS